MAKKKMDIFYNDRINIIKSEIRRKVDKINGIPDFVIASPAKTASTWLAKILGQHPDISIPSIKEVKYFCTYYRWYDLNWYMKHFSELSTLLKGDSSGTYFLLPVETIELIKRINSNCKIIIILRDPVTRVWSHLKHDFKYKTSTMREYDGTLEDLGLPDLIRYVTDDWQLAWCDYEQGLQRWSSVFPKEQMFIGFYEDIVSDPMLFLKNIHQFMNISMNCAEEIVREIVLKGIEYNAPEEFLAFLSSFYRSEFESLESFLSIQFNLKLPDTWRHTTTSSQTSATCIGTINSQHIRLDNFRFAPSSSASQNTATTETFPTYREAYDYAGGNRRCADDLLLSALDHNKIWVEARHLETYLDFTIMHHGTVFYGIYKSFIDIRGIDNNKLKQYLNQGLIHVAPTPAELKCNIQSFYFGGIVEDIDILALASTADRDFKDKMHIQYSCVTNRLDAEVSYEKPPKLLSEYKSFNIVYYRNTFLALSQSIGHFDITTLTVDSWEYFMSNGLACSAKDLNGIKGEIDNLLVRKTESPVLHAKHL